jgi:L,D-peptidoglycan transpeptidase YkuD (ErfK/YbiS/YcfS/YnhG family)
MKVEHERQILWCGLMIYRVCPYRCALEYQRCRSWRIEMLGLSSFALACVLLLAGLASACATPPAALQGIPATTSQVVLVSAPTATSTTAMIDAWQRTGNGWRPILGPIPAHIGADGVGQASESTSRTPAGLFSLTQTFGRVANPGTRQPWFHATSNDWWVSDVHSPVYNTHQTCAVGSCPFNEAAGENLGQAGAVYDYAAVIDYNRWPARPGAGSAFFLHVINGRPTAGCVTTDRATVITILRWLDPPQHPMISLTVR